MEAFIKEYSFIVVALIMVVEYLIGISKIKPNSTIEMVISILKFIFGLDKKEDEEPKKD